MSYIGNEPIVSATRTVTEVTATAGQTVFNANGGYTVGYLDVFLNGAQLQTVDFTATNGSSVTLTEAAQVNDVVRLVAWGTFQSANLSGAGLLDGTVTAAKFASGQTPSFNGITFPATQVASANANTLDDYEEGTWTPTFLYSSNNTSPTVNTLNFTYTKIGRVVHLTGYVSVVSAGSGNGLQITNLPFAGNANFNMMPLWTSNAPAAISFYIPGTSTSMQFGFLTGGSSSLNSSNMPGELSVQCIYTALN